MTSSTSIDGIAIDRLITKLRSLVPPAVLAELEQPDAPPLEADSHLFDAARWLGDVVEDRRQALAEDVRQLRVLFEELADVLVRVRDEIGLADDSAAAALTAALTREPA